MAPIDARIVADIRENWGVENIADALPKALRPERQDDPTRWSEPFLQGLQALSTISRGELEGVQTRLRDAMRGRIKRNKSTAGKVNWVTVADINNVTRHLRGKNESAKAARNTRPTDPRTPVHEYAEEEDSSHYSSATPPAAAPAAAGNGGRRVLRPKKILRDHNGNAVKPVPFPTSPHGSVARPVGRTKHGRVEVDDHEDAELPSTKRPNVQQNDTPDRRTFNDTGFISLDDIPATATRLEAQTLSRLPSERVAIPHWQSDMPARDPMPSGSASQPEVPLNRLVLGNLAEIGPGESALMNGALSAKVASVSLGKQHPIPANATLEEQIQLWQMRSRIADHKNQAEQEKCRYVIKTIEIRQREQS